MIIPTLYGRLGNQCFQIACAIAHGKRMGTKWGIPRSTLNPAIWPMYFSDVAKAPRGYATLRYYKEKRHCYDPLPDFDNMLIDGYFQSEKYFENAKEEVRRALGFAFAGQGEFVALHIRRGDYLQYPKEFPVLPMEYYEKAIEHFLNKGIDNIRVYSDDIPWCKATFSYVGCHFSFSNIKDPLNDMRDMYYAQGFIIANSSFSLFPALLAGDTCHVVAPAEDRWYGPNNKHLETHHLMPDRFVKL